MLDRDVVKKVLSTYRDAWQRHDSDLILSIFTSDAVYQERAFDAPHIGHSAIKLYWDTKVVSSQANIAFKLLNVYVDGNVAIAEWEAAFDDLVQNVRKKIREVAILEFKGELISSLREYWQGIEVKKYE